MSTNDGCGGVSVLMSFILGAMVGAGVAALLSPDSGAENRRKLSALKDDLIDRADGMADEAARKFTDARHDVEDSVSKGKEYIDEQKDILSSAIEAGREAYRKESESRHADEA